MATTVRVEVKGLRELGERLKALGLDFKQNSKIARAATNAGAQVIKKLAIKNAKAINRNNEPDTDGEFLADNIVVGRRKRIGRLTSQHAVTLRHKGAIKHKRASGDNPYQVGVLNEFGTVKMSAVPFMRPAFEQGKNAAQEKIVAVLRKRIEKAEKAVR